MTVNTERVVGDILAAGCTLRLSLPRGGEVRMFGHEGTLYVQAQRVKRARTYGVGQYKWFADAWLTFQQEADSLYMEDMQAQEDSGNDD